MKIIYQRKFYEIPTMYDFSELIQWHGTHINLWEPCFNVPLYTLRKT